MASPHIELIWTNHFAVCQLMWPLSKKNAKEEAESLAQAVALLNPPL